MKHLQFLGILLFCSVISSCGAQEKEQKQEITKTNEQMEDKVVKTDEEWRNQLTPDQYYILRQAGTERPGTGKYNLTFEDGVYHCAGCNAPLFKSDSKFESHCGWPSFDAPISEGTIVEIVDKTHGMTRTEIRCAKCDGHLGHVFNDGPTNTGVRYCINSGAIELEK